MYIIEYYAAGKKNSYIIPTFCDSMVGTGDDCAKWNKTVSKRWMEESNEQNKLMSK